MKSIEDDMSMSASEPILFAKRSEIVGPNIAPKLLPAAMNPKILCDCSLLKISAMKLQKTDMFKRLKTLTHT